LDRTTKRSEKVALVTGAGQGIGRAIGGKLAADGVSVALHERKTAPHVLEFARDLSQRCGVRCEVVSGDFRDPASIGAMFEQFDTMFDRLDIVVNNAGYETSCALEDMSLQVWDETIRIDLTAPFQISQAAFARMKSKGGVIVNISSIHEEIARKGASHYSCAKAGLRMLGRSAALEWAEYGVRVVTVSPGPIETDMNRHAIEELGRANFDSWIPAGRFGRPADVAAIVSFVCSDEAGFITGTEIYVDGGYMRNLVRYDDRPGRR
jgi:glucose 1-dehydrogenase